ncbi:MAG: serine/threonine protein kinase [Nitrososphaerota archaeon]|nr:serine/threonine protein kinase [Nitrososphaerota archaeon]
MKEARSRITQLRRLGVEEIIFEGKSKVGRLGLLGLGTVGVVVKARKGSEMYALKIRRTDANRPSMEAEFKLTALVNKMGVGPKVVACTRDFMLMELLDAKELADWLRGIGGQGSREAVRSVVHSLLNQCRTLDIMGVDHGQLSDLRKHAVMAGGRVWIIDFESGSRARRPKNVTTAAQYLLIGGALSPALRRALGVRDTEVIKALLSRYKGGLDDYSYSKILEHLKISAG